MTALLVVVALAFAWNLGAHYTGAVMGMPYAARSISLWPALALIAVMTVLGATFASGRVETTVGQQIISDQLVSKSDALAIVLAAGSLTMLYNYLRIPTSTIQILVFCVVGVGLAGNIPIHWTTIGKLAVVWVCAPCVAFGLGFLFTRLIDRMVPPRLTQAQAQQQLVAASSAERNQHWLARAVPGLLTAERPFPADPAPLPRSTVVLLRVLPLLLVGVGIAASFVLGANDVSNATGVFITHLYSLMLAGFLGGVAMAVGALTWGERILHTIAFDVVKMDLAMASAAQGVQALVVLIAAAFGFFTSMNQALIGAMAGTGFARGRETVQRKQLRGILRGWLIGPLSGLAVAAIIERLFRL